MCIANVPLLSSRSAPNTQTLSWSVNTHMQSQRRKWSINSTQSSVYVILNMPTVNITCTRRSSTNMQHDIMAVHYLHGAKSTWDSNKLSVNQELLMLWKQNVHYLGHKSSMQAVMLRLIILKLSAGGGFLKWFPSFRFHRQKKCLRILRLCYRRRF